MILSNNLPWSLNLLINIYTVRKPLIKKNVSTPNTAPRINWVPNELCKLSTTWTILSDIVRWKTYVWPNIIQNNEIARIPFKNEYVEVFFVKQKILSNVNTAEYSLRYGINVAKQTNRLSKIIRLNVNINPIVKCLSSDRHRIDKELK